MSVLEEFSTGLNVTPARKAAEVRTLRMLEASLVPASLLAAGGEHVQAFLERRGEECTSPNSVRKERGLISSFYTWAWHHGRVSAETLLSIRAVPVPAGSTGVARPIPYKRSEVQALWKLLDARWPRLGPEDAERFLRRWGEGCSPYARVRSHLIHLQLEAMITLALSCGMRRSEIYAYGVDDIHPDNGYIVVRGRAGTVLREVPQTRMAREAIAAWLGARARLEPLHDRAWLNLWAETTVSQPMTRHVFEKVVGTYLGPGWTFRRLRDTAAVEWLRAGLEIWHLQAQLGHRSMKDTLPYIAAAGGDLQRRMCNMEPAVLRHLG